MPVEWAKRLSLPGGVRKLWGDAAFSHHPNPGGHSAAEGCCLLSDLGEIVEDQVSEIDSRSKSEGDGSGMWNNQRASSTSCLGSVPRHLHLGAPSQLRALEKCEWNSDWLA